MKDFFAVRSIASASGFNLVFGDSDEDKEFKLTDDNYITLLDADTLEEVRHWLATHDLKEQSKKEEMIKEEKRTKEYQREGDTQDVDAV